jgi:hypothetical protein
MPMLETLLKQMLDDIISIQKLVITHTDLKLENILFKYSKIPSSEYSDVKGIVISLIIFY